MAHSPAHRSARTEMAQPCDPVLCSEPIQLEHLHFPAGEGDLHSKDRHTLFVNLSTRPIHYLQTQDGKTHTGLYRQGDFTVTPVDLPFFARWQGTENCLKIQFSDRWLQTIAQDTLAGNQAHLTLLPTFQSQHAPIAAIAPLLLAELQQSQPSGALYVDSLVNALAVQLLRHYATTPTQVPNYAGGLPLHQLQRVLDYIDAYLVQDLKLADLAQLLNMSPFHFSRMFKQAMGVAPHQYLIQQRVERAKQLLKTSDRPIIDIALDCGFSSHSHLSKQFRQLTGTTPKIYRASG